MADYRPYAGIEGAALTGGEGGDALHNLLMGVLRGTVELPERVVKAAQATAPGLRREDFTDIPGSAQPSGPLIGGAAETALNLAGVGTSFAPFGSAGVFGGRLAQTADLNALARAERMQASGADKVKIWDETGWFQGGDGKWRFEIPDTDARVTPRWDRQGIPDYEATKIAGQFWHDDLYKAYPDMRHITGVTEKTNLTGGSYSAPTPGDARTFGRDEMININAPSTPEARSVMLHELQHAIQQREGFAQGGSPAMFTQGSDAELARTALSYRRELEGLDPKLTPKQKDDIVRKRYEEAGAPDWFPSQDARSIAHDVEGNPADTLQRVMSLYGTDVKTSPYTPLQLYHELPGEVEARNVQARRFMSRDELREHPPWITQDVEPRPIMSEIFGQGRVGMLEGGAPQSNGPAMSLGSPIRAYHGSPHDFDKFDISKIGTGEGAQAYGHGLYFAEREGIAKSYRDALAADPRDEINLIVQGWTGSRLPGERATEEMVRKGLSNHHMASLNEVAKSPDFVRNLTTYINGISDDLRTVSPEAMRALRETDKVLPKPGGHMYEVNINADPGHFLDWDKPIAQQGSKIDQAMWDVLTRSGATKAEASHIVNTKTGQDAIRLIARPSFPIKDAGTDAWRAGGATFDESLAMVGGDKANVRRMYTPDPAYTREALMSERIPGVKYFDQTSRVGGEGPRNYVVFNDSIVDILRKYGIAGASPVGMLGADFGEGR